MEPAQLLGGRYRLEERIGRGGMSLVWRARDEVLHRPVAVKVLQAPLEADALARSQIQAEARTAARLSHPHLTSVHDYGECTDDSGECQPFVVMELLTGPTLAQRVAGGPLPPAVGLRVCAEVASGLAAAHDEGLVHRDVKPGNVVLTPSGAKVLDFGIAAAVGPPPRDTGTDSVIIGTPQYLAPERWANGDVVPASDVYALGVLLYRVLTGGLPWDAETVTQLCIAHTQLEPAPLPPIDGVPPQVVELCRRCLAKDPADRPTALEAADILADAAGITLSGPDDPELTADQQAAGRAVASPAAASPAAASPAAASPAAASPAAADPAAADPALAGPGSAGPGSAGGPVPRQRLSGWRRSGRGGAVRAAGVAIVSVATAATRARSAPDTGPAPGDQNRTDADAAPAHHSTPPGGDTPPGADTGAAPTAATGADVAAATAAAATGPTAARTSTTASGPTAAQTGADRAATRPGPGPDGPAHGPAQGPDGPAHAPAQAPDGPARGPAQAPDGPAQGSAQGPVGPAHGPDATARGRRRRRAALLAGAGATGTAVLLSALLLRADDRPRALPPATGPAPVVTGPGTPAAADPAASPGPPGSRATAAAVRPTPLAPDSSRGAGAGGGPTGQPAQPVTTPGTRTAAPAPVPTGGPPPANEVPPGGSTPTPEAPERALNSVGGTVVAVCVAGLAQVLSTTPTDGFTVRRADLGPARRLVVTFAGEDEASRIVVRCVDGVPTYTNEAAAE